MRFQQKPFADISHRALLLHTCVTKVKSATDVKHANVLTHSVKFQSTVFLHIFISQKALFTLQYLYR